MKEFISCDWGSSCLRVRMVDRDRLQWKIVEANDKGVAEVFSLWKEEEAKGKGSGPSRFDFYLRILKEQIEIVRKKTGGVVENLPVVISGMACSSIGMLEVDYKRIPFSCEGDDLVIKRIEASKDGFSEIIIISGARSDTDVMRGEETQVIGCYHGETEKRTYIFPGTHSKHVLVNKGKVIDIRTYMTGEFFSVLSERSMLSHSVQKGIGFANENDKKAFEAGLKESKQAGLLHSAFMVRTNHLFERFNREENYYFLSGLLIGSELGSLAGREAGKISLVASGELKKLYVEALKGLGVIEGEKELGLEDADGALVKGQLKVLERLK